MASHFSDQPKDYDSFSIPPEFKPMGAWAYFGYTLLFSLPLLGLIFLIVFSFSDANINRRNYARSIFISLLFGIILFVVLYFTGVYHDMMLIVNEGKWPAYLAFLPWV
ncbi:MAG: hypothetical protein Q4B54_06660 [Coriobacteriales bacterium]|nr:hypothetical protein [Coriobacteriales bacterium]